MSSKNSHPVERALLGLGFASLTLGSAVMVGWLSGKEMLCRLHPAWHHMSFNTALGFVLVGFSLLFRKTSPRLAQMLGLLVSLWGMTFLLESLSGRDLGIDQFFFKQPFTTLNYAVGRITPSASVSFVLMGFGLFMMARRAPAAPQDLALSLVGTSTLVISSFTLLGSLIGVRGLFAWGYLPFMSEAAAFGIAFLSLGILAFVGMDQRLQNSGKSTWPTWLPLPLLFAGLLGTWIIWQALKAEELRSVERTTEVQLFIIAQKIRDDIEDRARSLDRMAGRWALHRPSQAEWNSDAFRYVKDDPGYQAIQWFDANHRVQWVQPVSGNESAMGFDASYELKRRATMDLAKVTGRPQLTTTIDLVQGAEGMLLFAPIPGKADADGYIAGVFRTRDWIDHVLGTDPSTNYDVYFFEEGRQIYQSTDPDSQLEFLSKETKVVLIGKTWTLRVRPRKTLLAATQTNTPTVILVSGTLISLLMGFLVFQLQKIHLRSLEIRTINRALNEEIQERQRVESQLDLRAKELERSNKELETFAYVASHDLQEPLRMISSFTELLQKRHGVEMKEEAHEFMGYIVDAARRMQRLIHDLLQYSRIDRKQNPLLMTDISEVLQESLAYLKDAVKESGASVSFGPLPTVAVDRGQWVQLFQNLIGNALKFKGAKPPEIRIEAQRRASDWCFSVRDNGIGIDPKFDKRIFMTFQRLHTRETYEGTGIGLSVARKIIERHGGTIWVESAEGKGSTFFFTLPDDPLSAP
jgi:signal transduction histidine kinase